MSQEVVLLVGQGDGFDRVFATVSQSRTVNVSSRAGVKQNFAVCT